MSSISIRGPSARPISPTVSIFSPNGGGGHFTPFVRPSGPHAQDADVSRVKSKETHSRLFLSSPSLLHHVHSGGAGIMQSVFCVYILTECLHVGRRDHAAAAEPRCAPPSPAASAIVNVMSLSVQFFLLLDHFI